MVLPGARLVGLGQPGPAQRTADGACTHSWLHARLPSAPPGEYCDKTGTVIPRGGAFPEGQQPPGLAGWTRPIALEPIMIGHLIGTDGEIENTCPSMRHPST